VQYRKTRAEGSADVSPVDDEYRARDDSLKRALF